MAKVNRKIRRHHPRRIRRKIGIGVTILWFVMLLVMLIAMDGRNQAIGAVKTTFGVPDEVASDFVDRGGIKATLSGDLEKFLESEDGIGYDAEEKLVKEYGWTRQQILDRYPTTAWKSPAKKVKSALGL